MVKIAKRVGCIALCLAMIFSFSGCSGSNEMTRENVTETVEAAFTALNEFDEKALDKYVDSKTLSYILGFAKDHEQFSELGRAIFENLEFEIENIDLDAKTVDVSVKNKYLSMVASSFTRKLLDEHSKLQLLNLLNDDYFLDASLGELVDGINAAQMQDESVTITLKIVQGKKNLTLSFDDEAENAVSGGALEAIKTLI